MPAGLFENTLCIAKKVDFASKEAKLKIE